MEYNLEYDIKEFREEQKELFDDDGYRFTGTCMSDRQAEQMLRLINDLERALIKVDTKNATAILPDVSVPKGTFCRCGKPYSQKDLHVGMCHKCCAPTG